MNPKVSKSAAAEALLNVQGFRWFPLRAEWVHSPGLPLSEVSFLPGWYRCAQIKEQARTIRSWDGYAHVSREGTITHFDLSLRQRKWAPPLGYEDTVCFVPVDIRAEMRSNGDAS